MPSGCICFIEKLVERFFISYAVMQIYIGLFVSSLLFIKLYKSNPLRSFIRQVKQLANILTCTFIEFRIFHVLPLALISR